MKNKIVWLERRGSYAEVTQKILLRERKRGFAMPLTDFVRYLNAQHPVFFSGDDLSPTFAIENGRVFAHYAGLRLGSSFQAITDLHEDQFWGHMANLSVSRPESGMPLKPEVLFALPESDQEFIYLDRLVRTLHALNYLTYENWRSRGTLLLAVHPRHVASVGSDHGLAFENILRDCGLLPTQIALAFDIPASVDSDHLVNAFKNYRKRGFLVALKHPADGQVDWKDLAEISPEFVILGDVGEIDPRIVDEYHLIGARVIARGVDQTVTRSTALESGMDLLLAQPPVPKLFHAKPTVAEPPSHSPMAWANAI